MQAQEEFASLKAAKTKEIEAGVAAVKSKTQELATTDDQLATAKENLELTREALSADQKFLVDLNLRCQQTDKDFEERSKTRSEEIAAVSETISILSDDDARDLFSKNLGFVQKHSSSSDKRRSKAAAILKQAAAKSNNAMLLALSSTMQLDSFTKVKKAIDDMVAGLKQEQEDEVKHKDYCTAELNQNAKDTAATERELQELEASIADAKESIEQLTNEVAALKASNAELAKQMQQASEDRELENKEFQQAVADHRETQAILKKALARLQKFYGTNTALLQGLNAKADAWLQARQEPGAAVEPMPEGFKEYKKSGGAGGVVQLIQNIIDEAKGMENDALKAEADAQAAYEDFVKNSNDSTAANNKAITAKVEEKADTESSKVAAEGDHAAATSEQEQNANMAADLHSSCDFLLKNFDLRQAARSEELEALAQAKAILSGANLN